MNTPRKVVLGLLVALVGVFALLGPLTGGTGVFSFLNLNGASQQIPTKFDGNYLYKVAFKRVHDMAKPLADPVVRAKWAAEWEHKFDTDGSLATEEGTDRAITLMLNSLNQRFDHYSPPARFQAERDMEDASLVGIGVIVSTPGIYEKYRALPKSPEPTEAQAKELTRLADDSPLMIEGTIDNGPAAKAGILAADRVIAVDGKNVNGMYSDEVIKSIKGEAGTNVVIRVSRKAADGTVSEIDIPVVRAKVIVPVVQFKDLGNGTAYVKLENFVSDYAVSEMAAALNKAKGMKGLIVDLRGNGGGNLAYLEAISQQLLKEGTLMVLEQRSGDGLFEKRQVIQPRVLLTTGVDLTKPDDVQYEVSERDADLIIPAEMPIVVLVNHGSASASELLSGLLQANHRATIIGVPTLGKGVGQTVVPLPFGRSIAITTFEFLPGGARMDFVGVLPDIDAVNDDDPKVDEQLEAGKTEIQRQVAALEAANKKRDDVHKKNDEFFKKWIEERNANP